MYPILASFSPSSPASSVLLLLCFPPCFSYMVIFPLTCKEWYTGVTGPWHQAVEVHRKWKVTCPVWMCPLYGPAPPQITREPQIFPPPLLSFTNSPCCWSIPLRQDNGKESIMYILINICKEIFLFRTFFPSSKRLWSVFMSILKATSGTCVLGEG